MGYAAPGRAMAPRWAMLALAGLLLPATCASAAQTDAAAAEALDRIVERLPDDPAGTAQALAGREDGLALAWQVYLARFWPGAGIDAATATQLRARSVAQLRVRDGYPADVLERITRDEAPELADLTLLRMWLDLDSGGDPAAFTHCFVFHLHPRWAYRAMGPLYGSSRDISAPLCAVEGDLFERAGWRQLKDAFDPLLLAADAHADGTLRFASYAAWRVSALRATVSPVSFLDDPDATQSGPAPEQAIAAARPGWTAAQGRAAIAALDPARADTAAWLQQGHGLAPDAAAQIAAVIVADWVHARLSYVDDWWPAPFTDEDKAGAD